MTPPQLSNPLIDEPPAFPGLAELKACAKDEPLTKRDRFAKDMMKSLCANPSWDGDIRVTANDAVALADALILALKCIPEPV